MDIDKILQEGEELENWACDCGADGYTTQSNGGVERLIYYKNCYFTMVTDWERTKIYPDTLSELIVEELDEDFFIKKLVDTHKAKRGVK